MFETLETEFLKYDETFNELIEVNTWIRNPSISVEAHNEYVENFMDGFIPVSGPESVDFLQWIFSNPVSDVETMKNHFEGLLETTEPHQEAQEDECTFQEKKFAFVSGIASNPIAISRFGSRLLGWLIQNEEMLLWAENGFNFNGGYYCFPLSSLMLNSNLSGTTSQELADYLILNLKQPATTPEAVDHFTKWACFRQEQNSFFQKQNGNLFSQFSKKIPLVVGYRILQRQLMGAKSS